MATDIIAIQGTPGSFHQIAAKSLFGAEVQTLPCATFADVFIALQTQQATKAVVAVGNNRYGDISPVLDMLVHDHTGLANPQFWISGEVYVEVKQCLIGLPGATLETIKEVHSQAPALGQCQKFLQKNLHTATIIEQEDTAKSVKLVKEWNDPTKVAVASRAAAEIYGMQVLAEGIQDDELNITRFLVIQTQFIESPNNNKTTLLFKTDHQPGSLVRALAFFSNEAINFSYLQSMSIPNQPFQYRFYLEIEAGSQEDRAVRAFKTLNEIGYEVDVLGSYTIAQIPILS